MPGYRHTNEFLKQIAEEYRQAAKVRPFRPNVRVAEKHGVTVSRVETWIKAARHRGLLEPHGRVTCDHCHQTLRGLPPIIGHHFRASRMRMSRNAMKLSDRCRTLAYETDDLESRNAFLKASLLYRQIVRAFDGVKGQ